MTRKVVLRHLAFLCLVSLSSLGSVEEKRFDKGHRLARSHNPPGVDFTIRFQNGKTDFQIGERIPVELNFSSTAGDHYSVSNRSYDRSGRLNLDQFHITPEETVRDPLEGYFQAAPFSFLGGGLGGRDSLDLKPYSFTLDVNEWVSFTRPGDYRLYVVSGRVTRDNEIDLPLAVASNVVEFRIHPQDPPWSASLLEATRKALDRPDSPDEARRTACRSLRFLGTAEAGLEMARRLGTGHELCDWNYYFGLIASPHRSTIEAEMKKLLKRPDHPITGQFVRALSYLRYLARQPKAWKDLPFAAIPEELRQKAFRERCDVYREVTQDAIKELLRRILLKTGQAKAVSFQSALELFPQPTSDGPPFDEGLKRSLEAALVEAPDLIPELSIDEQERLLRYHWPALENADLAPMLRRIVDNATSETRRLADVALQRLLEIAPEEGRARILRQIADPRPRVRFDSLSQLPDEALPQLDDKMAENLEASIAADYDTFEMHSLLIQRYATAKIVERVDRIYASRAGEWGCRPSDALLAYLLRADPERGVERVREALQKREYTACHKYLLRNVSQMQWSPSLELLAVEFLTDLDPDVVSNAASTLSAHGSADVAGHLWERLSQWHDKWAARADELSHRNTQNEELEAEIRLGDSLVRSIIQGLSWLTDPSQAGRLRALSLTRSQLQAADFLEASWSSPLVIQAIASAGGSPNFIVAQYQTRSVSELKQKLRQFPSGATFRWVSYLAPRQDEKILAVIAVFAADRGFSLQRGGEK